MTLHTFLSDRRVVRGALLVPTLALVLPTLVLPTLVLPTLALPMSALSAQSRTADSLRLAPLLAAVERTDRRAAQLAIIAQQSELRVRSLGAERLPTVSALATGQYVSDVPSIGGVPMVPFQQYDAYLTVRQRLFDPTRAPRLAAEQAQFDESDARVRSALWQQRQAVSDAFFGALALDAERATLGAALADLEAQQQLSARRAAAGAALSSEPALFEAEILRRRQAMDALDSDRRATLAILASLTGTLIDDATPIAVPDLALRVAAARAALDSLHSRPEYAQFAAARSALIERGQSLKRQDLPRLSAFGRTGYGRPGINPLARDFQAYWIAGLQLEWAAFNWGTTARDQEIQTLQSQLVERDEEAFTAQLQRAATRDLATIDRLERTLASDDAIIALHARILTETQRRHTEGAVTAAEYVDRETDLLTARVSRDLHRVRLAEARARFLTTLGQEIR